MEKQITAAALVLSIAGLGYLKAQQLERMEAQAERDAAAAVMAAEDAAEAHDASNRVQFEVPHDRDASTSEVDIVLDGKASFDAESDSISFSWVQTEGPDVALSEDEPGRSSFRADARQIHLRIDRDRCVRSGFQPGSARERDVRTQHCAGSAHVCVRRGR